MITMRTYPKWGLTIIAVLAVVLGIALAAVSGPAAQAAPAQQGKVCTWQNVGNNKSNLFHVASASDTDLNAIYLYGGVNEKLEPQNRVEKVDISDPADLKATTSIVPASGSKKLVGSAGAYRAKGDTDDSAAYWFGGNANPGNGQGTTFVQRYLTKSTSWEQVSATNASVFRSRFFASAAYDPVHDVIWVVGGTNSCKLGDVLQGQSCNATNMATQYLKFDDPNPGEMTWYTLAGGEQAIYAATMVYDSANKQMVLHGGTKNISQAQSAVKVLDLADADEAKASWKSVSPSGSAPKVYFHDAAYTPADGVMYVYGGVKQNFMQSNESTNTTTYALDLSLWPNPTWVNLSPAGTPGGRVASGYGYNPLHNAFVVSIGRDTFEVGDPLPDQDIQKNSYALTCEEPEQPTATNTPDATSSTPTNTPVDTPDTPTPTPTMAPPPDQVCDFIIGRVPAQVISSALTAPASVRGYGELCNPNLPPDTGWNHVRNMLSIEHTGLPYHPLYNSLEWKCGCP